MFFVSKTYVFFSFDSQKSIVKPSTAYGGEMVLQSTEKTKA